MCKFFENKFVFAVILSLFVLGYGWNLSQGATVPPHRLLMESSPLIAHGPSSPPDPWDQVVMKHGPSSPPDPWDQVAAV